MNVVAKQTITRLVKLYTHEKSHNVYTCKSRNVGTGLDVGVEAVHVGVVLDGVQRDGPVHFSLLEGPREGLRAAAVVVQDTLHL